MLRVRLTTVVLSLLCVAGASSAGERITRLSLDEAVSLATRENPSLRAKEFEYRAVRANEVTAGLRPNPTASFLAEKFGSSGIDREYTVSVGQTIETGGKRQRRLESALAATNVARHELTGIRRQVLFQVKRSFTDILVAQAALSLAEENLRTLGEIERVQRFRAERGDISELELLRIQVQQFTFERDAVDARQAVRAAKIALRAAIGSDRLAEEFEVVDKLDFRDFAFTRDELYRLALAGRPEIRAAEAVQEKARADVNLARANASWDVTPLVEYMRIGNNNVLGFGISVPIRIFDRNQGEIARARAEALRVEALRQTVVVQVLSEVETALAAFVAAREKVRALRDTYLPKAQRARETVEFAYQRRGISLLDFLDAQRTYRETSLGYVRALGDYWTAVYQIEAGVGGSFGN